MPALGVATLASVVPAAVSCAKYETTECELNAHTMVSGSLIPDSITFSNKKAEKGKDFVTKVSWVPPEGIKSLYAYEYKIHVNNNDIGQNTVNNPNGWVVLSHNDNEIEFKIPAAALGDIKQQKPKIDFYFNFREADLDVLANLDTWSDDIWTDPEDDVEYQGLSTTINVPAPDPESEEPNKRVEVEIPLNKWANSKKLPQNDLLYLALVEDNKIVSIQGMSKPYLGLIGIDYTYVTIAGKTVVAIQTPKEGWGNLGNLSTINFYFATYQKHTNLKVSLIEPKTQVQQYNVTAIDAGLTAKSFKYSSKQGTKGKDFVTTVSWTAGFLEQEHQYVTEVVVKVNGEQIYQDHYDQVKPGYHIISKGYNNMTFNFDKEVFKDIEGTPNITLDFYFDNSSIDDYVDVDEWQKSMGLTVDGKTVIYKNVLSSNFFSVRYDILQFNNYTEANIRMDKYKDGAGIPEGNEPLYLGLLEYDTEDTAHLVDIASSEAHNEFRIGQYNITATDIVTEDDPWKGWIKLEPTEGNWAESNDAGKLSSINGNIHFVDAHKNLKFVLVSSKQ